MFGDRKCGRRKMFGNSLGTLLIAVGAGILLGHIIPYYILIIIFGIGLIAVGISVLGKN